jgi:hypothetical protein
MKYGGTRTHFRTSTGGTHFRTVQFYWGYAFPNCTGYTGGMDLLWVCISELLVWVRFSEPCRFYWGYAFPNVTGYTGGTDLLWVRISEPCSYYTGGTHFRTSTEGTHFRTVQLLLGVRISEQCKSYSSRRVNLNRVELVPGTTVN